MVYDGFHGNVVLFGGSAKPAWSVDHGWLNDTWLWTNGTWIKESPAGSPTARGGAAIGFDGGRHQVVLFGGLTSSGTAGAPLDDLLADTWLWDGVNWTVQQTAHTPAPRLNATIVFDAQHGGLLLYGGFGSAGPLTDGWLWSGIDWTPIDLAGVAPQVGSRLALDPNGGVIAIGSCAAPNARLSGHATLSGAAWLATANVGESSIGSRCHAAVATDLEHHVLLIYGGTYQFPDGIASGPSPSNRITGGMEWDGISWKPIPDGPSPRVGAELVYDLASHVFLLFGGDTGPDVPTSNDTWLWDGKSWAQP